jgi:hypothetical protein
VLDDPVGGGVDDAGEDRHPTADRSNRNLDHRLPLPTGEDGDFAGRAEQEETMHAAVEQEAHQIFQRGCVDVVIHGQRGANGRDDAMQSFRNSGHE